MPTFTIKLDDETLRKLTEAAGVSGVTPARMAEMLLEAWPLAGDEITATPGVGEPASAWASAPDPVVWHEGGDPRDDNAANYDLNEAGRPWSEVRPEMEALLERKLAERE